MMIEHKFLNVPPSNQNILDLFAGEWSSKMPSWSGLVASPGHAELFNDARVHWAWDQLGPFNDMDIIELGPLEGAHSFMFENMGAKSVTAIESNTRSFLRCLCVKQIFNLKRVNFVLGNFLPYLENTKKVDFLFASGVLYHMTDPLILLKFMCACTDRLFIWTHYYDEDVVARREDILLFAVPEAIGGTQYRGAKRLYPEAALNWQGFSGGADSYSIWLERASLLNFLQANGFEVSINFDHKEHPNGPALALCARR